jgi:hypothetical protein
MSCKEVSTVYFKKVLGIDKDTNSAVYYIHAFSITVASPDPDECSPHP